MAKIPEQAPKSVVCCNTSKGILETLLPQLNSSAGINPMLISKETLYQQFWLVSKTTEIFFSVIYVTFNLS